MHKKEEKKEDRQNGTQILETEFHLYFKLQGTELQRERDTFEFISFSFGIWRVLGLLVHIDNQLEIE